MQIKDGKFNSIFFAIEHVIISNLTNSLVFLPLVNLVYWFGIVSKLDTTNSSLVTRNSKLKTRHSKLLLIFLYRRLYLLYPVCRTGVRAHKFRLALAAAGLFEDLHDFDECFRIISGLDHKAYAEII